jgi:nucleolar complex protein 2
MAQSKATKKFEKNKLKDILERRKKNAKIKQQKQMSTKRKERRAKDNARAEDLDGDESTEHRKKQHQDTSIGEMSMDQFFQGGFQIPELNKKSTKPTTGKRKRTPVEQDGASDLEEDIAPKAVATAGDSASEDESVDDANAHKEQLAALAEKDPEFYNYLKENDAELLEFEEDADLAEIDALSASEDEHAPRKKQKPGKEEAGAQNEVTKELVKKWKSSMENSFSLRAMKETVLAFRAAAHLNEDSKKQYRYSISDSNGMSKQLLYDLVLIRVSVPRSACGSPGFCA